MRRLASMAGIWERTFRITSDIGVDRERRWSFYCVLDEAAKSFWQSVDDPEAINNRRLKDTTAGSLVARETGTIPRG